MRDIIVNLIANSIWAFLGVISVYIYRLLFSILPTRRLWRIKNPNELIICVSTSENTDTGEYNRPATGIGQVQALAYIFPSLNSAYSGIQIRNILLSEESLKDGMEKDLIVLGGPKNNQITRKILDKIRHLHCINQTENGIFWLAQPQPQLFKPEIINKIVVKDYGIILRMKNPCSRSKNTNGNTICLFSGCHTYGTIAAARCFVEDIDRGLINKYKDNFIMVVSCNVSDGYPTSIKTEKVHIFK